MVGSQALRLPVVLLFIFQRFGGRGMDLNEEINRVRIEHAKEVERRVERYLDQGILLCDITRVSRIEGSNLVTELKIEPRKYGDLILN